MIESQIAGLILHIILSLGGAAVEGGVTTEPTPIHVIEKGNKK